MDFTIGPHCICNPESRDCGTAKRRNAPTADCWLLPALLFGLRTWTHNTRARLIDIGYKDNSLCHCAACNTNHRVFVGFDFDLTLPQKRHECDIWKLTLESKSASHEEHPAPMYYSFSSINLNTSQWLSQIASAASQCACFGLQTASAS